jgi:hypothetical protein
MNSKDSVNDDGKDFIEISDLKSLTPKVRHKLDEIGSMLGEISNQTRPHKKEIKKAEKAKKKLVSQFLELCADLGLRRIKGNNWKSYWKDGQSRLSIERLLENGVSIEVINKCKIKGPGTRVIVGLDDDENGGEE